MQEDFYLNTLYPLQDKILRRIADLDVNFYLTGGTALSRAYLDHRYSDDLDFFVNNDIHFQSQVTLIANNLKQEGLKIDIPVTSDSFARFFVEDDKAMLKLDFVNDVSHRSGLPVETLLFKRTDSVLNILSNKISALTRYAPKDIADIIYISLSYSFNWVDIFNDASKKDLWVNPIDACNILDEFPLSKINEIHWIKPANTEAWFKDKLSVIIKNILEGDINQLYTIAKL